MRNKRASALLDVTEDSYQIRRLDSAISNARFTITKYIEDTREVIGGSAFQCARPNQQPRRPIERYTCDTARHSRNGA